MKSKIDKNQTVLSMINMRLAQLYFEVGLHVCKTNIPLKGVVCLHILFKSVFNDVFLYLFHGSDKYGY